MRKRTETRAAVLLGILALLSTLVAPRSLVLCIGEAGHVVIEAAVEITPCGVPLRAPGAFGAPPLEACSDFDLVQAALRSSVAHDMVPFEPVASVALFVEPAFSSAGFRTPERALSSLDPALRAHRTIVLIV